MERDQYAGEAMAKSAAREKRWEEMGIEEKVERLRMALRVASERATSGQRIAIEGLDVAKNHEHATQGHVLVPAENNRNHPLLLIGRNESADDIVERLLA